MSIKIISDFSDEEDNFIISSAQKDIIIDKVVENSQKNKKIDYYEGERFLSD